MLPLIALTESELSQITSQVPGGAANIQDIYPLGVMQQGILFTHQMSKENDPYVISTLFEVQGRDFLDDVINSLELSISRHDVLRTLVLWEGLSQPVQVVCREAALQLNWLEFDADVEHEMRCMALSQHKWMDLTQASLLEMSVARGEEPEQYFLLLQYHHVISDHLGLEIIEDELKKYRSGRLSELGPVTPYRNFIAHTLEQSEKHDAHRYFTELLGDIDEPTLPFGLVDVQGDGTRIIEKREVVPTEVSRDIRRLSQSLKLSPASLFHAAFGMLLNACSGREQVVFGSVMSGRLQGVVGGESMLGVFINTLPVRLDFGNMSVHEYVLHTQARLESLLPFEQASLALAQSCSGLTNNIPLFSAVLNYRHSRSLEGDAEEVMSPGESSLRMLTGQERSNYPFNLDIDDWESGFSLDFQVDNSIDIARVMSYMQTALVELVKELASDSDKQISELSILPLEERQQQLVEWNGTAADYPKDKCIHELFEAQVAGNPEAIAVVCGDKSLTYGELNARSNQLAHYLREERGVIPDSLVGICVERSLDMIVGIMGILKAGGGAMCRYPQCCLYLVYSAS
jgi:hypothetical protein